MRDCNEHLLIVDDDQGVLTALEAELLDHYHVTPVNSGEQALTKLHSEAFAAIVCDVRMPGLDGLSLIKQCAVRYPEMVRILLTAFPEDAVVETALGDHGAYQLTKPWGDNLLITLHNALSQRETWLDLKQLLEFKSDLLDFDSKLSGLLDPDEMISLAAREIARLPETIKTAVYKFGNDGRLSLFETSGANTVHEIPELMMRKTKPIAIEHGFLYSVPIGDWPAPHAAVATLLSTDNLDIVRYIDFVGRQTHRSIRLCKIACDNRQSHAVIEYDEAGKACNLPLVDNMEFAHSLTIEMATLATVVVSGADTLNRLVQSDRLGDSLHGGDNHSLAILSNDLKTTGDDLTILVDQFRDLFEGSE